MYRFVQVMSVVVRSGVQVDDAAIMKVGRPSWKRPRSGQRHNAVADLFRPIRMLGSKCRVCRP